MNEFASAAVVEVLNALLHIPTYGADRHEQPGERIALFWPVAQTIASVSKNKEERAAMVTLLKHESGGARYVLSGHCSQGPVGARCDHGHARGPFQVHSWCKDAYSVNEDSPESLQAGALCAIHMLRAAKYRCASRNSDLLAGMFSGYRSSSCTWPPARDRAHTMRAVLESMNVS